jgi:hypothetical protein
LSEADETISRSADSLIPDQEPEYDPEEESKDENEPGRKRKKIQDLLIETLQA